MKQQYYLFIVASVLFAASCQTEKNYPPIGKVLGYKPIYSSSSDLFTIQSQPARTVSRAGKIYVKDNYIFQNEIGEGIHIINNANPVNAQRIGFIKIKGSEEISIKGNYLYSNNFVDLVVVDITNLANVAEVSRTKNAFFTGNSQLAPPVRGGYFECVDASKGTVVSWARDSVNNPKCRN